MSDEEENDGQQHNTAATREEPAEEFISPVSQPSKDESEAGESESSAKAP